jgi:hypothetical protein
LSHYLFDLVMDEVTKDTQGDITCCMLFSDDVVLVDDSRTWVNMKLELQRQTLKTKGLRLSRTKTGYMRCSFSTTRHKEEEFSIDELVVPHKDTIQYLESMLQKDVNINKDVNHRIKAIWMKWHQASSILCDKRVPQSEKESFIGCQFDPQCCRAPSVGRLKAICSTISCGEDADVEMDVWPHKEGMNPE